MYHRVSNVCTCYPECKQLNTYHHNSSNYTSNINAQQLRKEPIRPTLDILAPPCDCKTTCNLTQTPIVTNTVVSCNVVFDKK